MKHYLIYCFVLLMVTSCGETGTTNTKEAAGISDSSLNKKKNDTTVIANARKKQPEQQAADFKATGNEPFWLLEINFSQFIHFKTMNGLDITTPVPEVVKAANANVTRYAVKTEKGELIVQLQKLACINDMSGKESPYTVTVDAKGNTEKDFTKYKGCGDYLSKPMPGSDSDEHGCKASAGYQWSVIKNNCIRVFEDGTKLNPLEATPDKTTAAYIVFSNDKNKAELFAPSVKGSIILERKTEGEAWANGEWMLIPWKGYVLKKKNVPVYGGQ